MDYQVLVEKQPANGFVAVVLGWPECSGIGDTKDEALAQVRTVIAERLARAEIVRLQVDAPTTVNDPWEKMIGSFANDPQWDEVQAELQRIREEANRD